MLNTCISRWVPNWKLVTQSIIEVLMGLTELRWIKTWSSCHSYSKIVSSIMCPSYDISQHLNHRKFVKLVILTGTKPSQTSTHVAFLCVHLSYYYISSLEQDNSLNSYLLLRARLKLALGLSGPRPHASWSPHLVLPKKIEGSPKKGTSSFPLLLCFLFLLSTPLAPVQESTPPPPYTP
jgi:hypothetical protein